MQSEKISSIPETTREVSNRPPVEGDKADTLPSTSQAQASVATAPVTAAPADSDITEIKKCPCKDVASGKPLWIKCNRPNCKQWWHAICAGFPKAKRAALDSIGVWVCPRCVMEKYSEHSSMGVNDVSQIGSNLADGKNAQTSSFKTNPNVAELKNAQGMAFGRICSFYKNGNCRHGSSGQW